jgi:hypothetical protein
VKICQKRKERNMTKTSNVSQYKLSQMTWVCDPIC